MFLAKVVGNVWSTKKNEDLVGLKLLLVQPIDKEGQPFGNIVVTVDQVGAGIGEIVIVAQGSSARKTIPGKEIPIDASVVGIVDTIEVERSGMLRGGNEECLL
ncbi:MAG: EutN/CcmL family microcompartment protein [Thermacetogeniaceae bacterium]